MDEHSRMKAPEPALRSGSQGGQDPRPPGRHAFHMSDLPTSWAESGLESNPLCFKARAPFERFQESCRPADPSFFPLTVNGHWKEQDRAASPRKTRMPWE